ncbi:hypothetical protein BC938DRAFT_471123 [Jimgerdemannia flammicorona]|uniref:Major facilitator superfamily (MFS) profile domain-containing protein n=1 Tax=Jimgerdemannia flammicorona TaxID=994334 RepID=A0A433Q8V3_9FUNG|nr:hypothetical protein BC938DRAFT_471123 [Jimgerdemannia flammicorona]
MAFLSVNTLCNIIVFTCAMMITDSTPARGTVNGIVIYGASTMRAIGPAACGAVYRWALGEG